MAMAYSLVSIAHIVAAVFAVIELILTAYASSRHSSAWFGWSFPRLSFMIFNSVWSLLVLVYVGLTPLYLTSVFHKLAATALNIITALFWFAGSIALAVVVARGVLAAAVAFGFFLWVIFTFLAVLDTLEALRSRGHNTPTISKPSAYPGA